MADTLFKGETLRAILLNAYGWWTVATIALFAGFVMVAAGIALFILAIFGFRHAKRAEAERVAAAPVVHEGLRADERLNRDRRSTTRTAVPEGAAVPRARPDPAGARVRRST